MFSLISLKIAEESVERHLQSALSSYLTLPMPSKGAIILIGSYKVFNIKHYIKEYFCLGDKILLSPTENFKCDENRSPIYTVTLRTLFFLFFEMRF